VPDGKPKSSINHRAAISSTAAAAGEVA